MDYQLITNILLAVSGFLSLVVMIRWDLLSLQQNGYSNKAFMEWLQQTDESYSTKRIVPMAALVACATPWARESWMVVGIIALAMAALAITILVGKGKELFQCSKRATAIILSIIVVVAMCACSLFQAHFSLEAGMMVLLFTAFSYVLTLGANWIISLFIKDKQ